MSSRDKDKKIESDEKQIFKILDRWGVVLSVATSISLFAAYCFAAGFLSYYNVSILYAREWMFALINIAQGLIIMTLIIAVNVMSDSIVASNNLEKLKHLIILPMDFIAIILIIAVAFGSYYILNIKGLLLDILESMQHLFFWFILFSLLLVLNLHIFDKLIEKIKEGKIQWYRKVEQLIPKLS